MLLKLSEGGHIGKGDGGQGGHGGRWCWGGGGGWAKNGGHGGKKDCGGGGGGPAIKEGRQNGMGGHGGSCGGHGGKGRQGCKGGQGGQGGSGAVRVGGHGGKHCVIMFMLVFGIEHGTKELLVVELRLFTWSLHFVWGFDLPDPIFFSLLFLLLI